MTTSGIRRSWPWWRWVLTGLSALGFGLSAYLSWNHLVGSSVIGCGGVGLATGMAPARDGRRRLTTRLTRRYGLRHPIVGAGMGGLMTALALRQSGVFASVDVAAAGLTTSFDLHPPLTRVSWHGVIGCSRPSSL